MPSPSERRARETRSGEAASARQRRRDPPDLALEQVGGGHARQLGRQAQGRRQRKADKTGQAPERAGRTSSGFPPGPQQERAVQQQREAEPGQNVEQGGEGDALGAVRRLPLVGRLCAAVRRQRAGARRRRPARTARPRRSAATAWRPGARWRPAPPHAPAMTAIRRRRRNMARTLSGRGKRRSGANRAPRCASPRARRTRRRTA